jgi:hypothetical protein
MLMQPCSIIIMLLTDPNALAERLRLLPAVLGGTASSNTGSRNRR